MDSRSAHQSPRKRHSNGYCCPKPKRKPKVFNYKPRHVSTTHSTLKPNSRVSKKRRIFWLVACIVSAGIFVGQLHDRLTYYFKVPIITGVSVMQSDIAHFPHVLLCPANLEERFGFILSTQVGKFCRENAQCSEECANNASRLRDYPFRNMNLTVEKIWNAYSINKSLVVHFISCAGLADKSACKSDRDLKWQEDYFYTLYGRCAIYTLEEEVEYHGPSTYWKFHVDEHLMANDSTEDVEHSDIMFYVSHTNSYLYHESYYVSRNLLKFQHTDVHISSKHFEFLNKTDRRCYDLETVLHCKNNCYNKKLESGLKCRLPFFNSSVLEPCSTYNDTLEAYIAAGDMYMSIRISDCHCHRLCHDVTYTTLIDVVPMINHSDQPFLWTTSFTIYFSDNNVEFVKENYLYTFPALLSDIAGNIGFFLGLSVLTALDGIITIFSYLHNMDKNHNLQKMEIDKY